MKTAYKWILIFLICSEVLLIQEESFSQSLRKPSIEKGKRDPFSLPYGVYPRSHESSQGVKPKHPTLPIQEVTHPNNEPKEVPLRLKAILISDSLRLAMINQLILQEGDVVFGEKVVEIMPDQVTLKKGDRKRTLFLDQSSIKLITEESHIIPSLKGGNRKTGGAK